MSTPSEDKKMWKKKKTTDFGHVETSGGKKRAAGQS